MDKKYWENYYKDAQVEYQPSPFAQFVFSNCIPIQNLSRIDNYLR